MKWLFIAILAFCILLLTYEVGTLNNRVNTLECLSGSNCARIDTLEAYYAGRTDAEVR